MLAHPFQPHCPGLSTGGLWEHRAARGELCPSETQPEHSSSTQGNTPVSQRYSILNGWRFMSQSSHMIGEQRQQEEEGKRRNSPALLWRLYRHIRWTQGVSPHQGDLQGGDSLLTPWPSGQRLCWVVQEIRGLCWGRNLQVQGRLRAALTPLPGHFSSSSLSLPAQGSAAWSCPCQQLLPCAQPSPGGSALPCRPLPAQGTAQGQLWLSRGLAAAQRGQIENWDLRTFSRVQK